MRVSVIMLALAAAGALGEGVPFLTGGDISALPKLESLGAVYRDDGQPGDAIAIMRKRGCNCFRVRLFVQPTLRDVVVQDVPYALALSRRIKASGASLLLDLHYSDTWADPQKQAKPAAWTNLTFNALERQIETYTADVVRQFKEAGCLPEIIQIGNEITPGFLWPDGKLGAGEECWNTFATLLRAGIRGARRPLAQQDRMQVMLHVDCGGSAARTRWFFDHIRDRAINYDLIGLSYYPWWHGGLDKLRENVAQAATRYGKPVVVVETAYPWRQHDEKKNMNWPMTPGGQAQFTRELIEAVRAAPNGLGRGVLWWYPESVRTSGLTVWKGGDVALFDASGCALPALGELGR